MARWLSVEIEQNVFEGSYLDMIGKLRNGISPIDIFVSGEISNVEFCKEMEAIFLRNLEHMMSDNIDNIDIYRNITDRSLKLIMKDNPRTLDAFIIPSNYEMSELKKLRQEFESILLCNLLTSSALTTGQYCQGWNFLCASFLLVYDDKINSNMSRKGDDAVDNGSNRQLVGAECQESAAYSKYSGFVPFMIAMTQGHLGALYLWGPHLHTYISVLEHNLKRFRKCIFSVRADADEPIEKVYSTIEAYGHLETIGFKVDIFALEWITTGFGLTLSLDVVGYLLDLIVTGIVSDVFLRASVAIVALLADDLMALDIETLQMEFRPMVRRIRADELIPLLLCVDISSDFVGGNGLPVTNVLEYLHTVPETIWASTSRSNAHEEAAIEAAIVADAVKQPKSSKCTIS